MRSRTAAAVVLSALLLALLPQTAHSSPRRTAFVDNDNRVGGIDRYNTAVLVSEKSFLTTAPAVVLASGQNPFDAEIGMSLAGAVGGPVLLTPQSPLHSATSSELLRLQPSRVFVIGSVDDVGDGVVAQVEALPWNPTVVRLGGSTSFEVADAVAKQVKTEMGGTLPNGAFLLYGGLGDWTSLVAIAPYAYSRKMPILLSWYSYVSDEAIDAISSAGIDRVIVANSEFYQSPAVEQQLADLGVTVERVREKGKFGLATAMAQHAVDKGWASYANIVLGTDANWPDNLAAGVLAGAQNGVFMFTDPTTLPFATRSALWDLFYAKSTDATVTAIGSTSVVAESVLAEVGAMAGATPGTIAGTVTADGSGAPLAGIRVTAWGWDPTSVTSPVFFSGEATTAADGSYSIGGLEPRKYFVLFQDPTHARVGESLGKAPSSPGAGDPVGVSAYGTAAAGASLYDYAGWTAQRVGRLSGTDRYQTAIEISRRNYTSAEKAIIVTGAGFADALSASALAGAYHAPLLLTRYDTLPPGLVTELKRLGVKSVFIVGSDRVVSNSIVAQLADQGIALDERIAGANRYATSVAVLEHLVSHGFGVPGDPFIARGDTFPDALSAAPAAYQTIRPILLVNPTSVPAEVSAVFAKYEIGQVIVMGSENAVARSVLQQLAGDNGLGGIWYYRFGGTNRYETASAFVSAWFGGASFMGIATGENFPDALSGGALAGSRNGALLLTPRTTLDPSVASVLEDLGPSLWAVRVFGSTSAVGQNVQDAVAAGTPYGGAGTLSLQSLRQPSVREPGPSGPRSVVYAR